MQVFPCKATYAGIALVFACWSLGGPQTAGAETHPVARKARAAIARGQKPANYAQGGGPISGSHPIRLVSGTEPEPLPPHDSESESQGKQQPSADQLDESYYAGVQKELTPIDLSSALQLAGIRNLELVVAQQRVEASVAEQQLAAAQILPSLNLGTNYDNHTGVLQQASGNILAVNRSALYVGAGANAVAAGTVSIPGLQYNLNISESIYKYLVSRKVTHVAQHERRARQNQVLLDVASAYADLLRAEGLRSVTILTRNDAREVARLTAAYAKTGEGRQSDADRAATELARRREDVIGADAHVGQASRRLCQLLNLDATLRLHPVESQVVPQPIVPTQVPLSELLAIALLERPELQARRSAVEAALLELDSAKVLPFSPQLLGGFSGGVFGGGSNLASGPNSEQFGVAPGAPRFGDFKGRTDMDLVLYWSLKNLGFGNKALIDAARARLNGSQFEQLAVLDKVRAEVAESYSLTHARFAEIPDRAQGVRTGMNALKEDLIRVQGRAGLPIEVLDSVRQLSRSRQEYLDAIVDYNQAQFELYVALGNPPADRLARPVPSELDQSPGDAPTMP